LNESVYIIAEAGVNHCGEFEKAISLIDIAAEAGANAVKFQTFSSVKLAASNLDMVDYQKRNIGKASSQLEMLKSLELSLPQHFLLKNHADLLGIDFLSTPFDVESLNFLVSMGLPSIKIASGEAFNGPLVWQAARSGLPLIISTGMSTIDDIKVCLSFVCHALFCDEFPKNRHEIEQAFETYHQALIDSELVTLLHCNSLYPTPFESVNLKAMCEIGELFGLPVGYSDHTVGDEAALVAAALGASIIEKHFTLDKGLVGPDHIVSLDPTELKNMVRRIRNTEIITGKKEKIVSITEMTQKSLIVKKLQAAVDIKKGTRFDISMIDSIRSPIGVPVTDLFVLLGTHAKQNYKKGDVLELEAL